MQPPVTQGGPGGGGGGGASGAQTIFGPFGSNVRDPNWSVHETGASVCLGHFTL